MDAVDRILEQWRSERPDLDASPMGVSGRLARVYLAMQTRLETVFDRYDLAAGEFDMLATLRRAGAPYALTPSELGASMMITSGTVTKRIDRLERRGLVSRAVSPDDARGRVVALTDAGFELVDRAVTDHVENLWGLLEPLDERERDTLAALLRKLDAPGDA